MGLLVDLSKRHKVLGFKRVFEWCFQSAKRTVLHWVVMNSEKIRSDFLCENYKKVIALRACARSRTAVYRIVL